MKKIIVITSIIASASMGLWMEHDFTSSAPALSFAITKNVKNPVEKNIPHPDVNQFAKERLLFNSNQSIPQQQFTQRSEKLTN